MKSNTRRSFIKKSAALGLSAAVATSCARYGLKNSKEGDAATRKDQKPNLLFVFPDQMRRQAMGFLGEDPVISPHLDAFSRESLVLTHATSTHPLCSPYRGMLFTGLYPRMTGLLTNCHSTRKDIYLRRSTTTLTDILHQQHYDVGYVGKWHLKTPEKGFGYKGPWVPPEDRHGINFWYSWSDKHENNFYPSYWTTEAAADETTDPGRVWCAEHETDVAIEYLKNRGGNRRDDDKPFALFVSWNPPHGPFRRDEVPARYYDQYGDATNLELLNRPNVKISDQTRSAAKHARGYFASVTGIDDQFGRLLQALEAEGLEENTIVIFTSDHGEMLGGHELMGKNQAYEESFGIPLMVRWPGQIQPKKDDLLLGTLDLMPTILAMLNLQDHAPDNLVGRDYSSLFFGNEVVKRPEVAWYYNASRNGRGLRTHSDVCFFERSANESMDFLFNLLDDPYQLKNLAKDQPRRVREFGREVKDWLVSIDDDFSDFMDSGSFLDTIPT